MLSETMRLPVAHRVGFLLACSLLSLTPHVRAQSPLASQGVILRSIDPGLVEKIGVGDPSYAERVSTERVGSSGAQPGDRFVAPNGKPVAVSIVPPNLDGAFQASPMRPGQDAVTYFQSVIAQAGPHKTIVLPKGGIYDFTGAGCRTGGAHLKLNDVTDVVIDGNGSRFNFTAPCAGLTLINPTRVVLKNVTIDWPKLQIAALGTIVSSVATAPRRNTYDLQLDQAYVGPATPPAYKAIHAWDVDHGYWSLQHPEHDQGYNPSQPLSASGAARGVQSWAVRFAPGERVLVRHYTTEGDAIDILHGRDVALENVTIYSSPGFGVAVLQGSSGFAISHSKITRAPGRLISTAADAVHIDNMAGDVLIEDNTFAYQGDDGLNLNATLFLVATTGASEITIRDPHAGVMKAGDAVALFNAVERFDEGGPTKIVAITPDAGGALKLTLDRPIPATDQGGYLVDLNYAGARYIVRNNQFLHNRARGALLQTPYGLVSGNTFTGQTMYALFLTVFPIEGPGAQNVLIVDNDVSATGVGGGLSAVILSRERNAYGPPGRNPPVHQNIIFADNRIRDVPGPAFYISSANNVVLYRNSLQNANGQVLNNRWNGAVGLNFPIVINDASNIIVRDDTIGGVRLGKAQVFADPVTTTGIQISPP